MFTVSVAEKYEESDLCYADVVVEKYLGVR